MSEESPKRGRPVGTVETPEDLLRRELIAYLKLGRRLREIMERKIEAVTEDKIDASTLETYTEIVRKSVVDIVRSIVPQAKPVVVSAELIDEDPQQTVDRILGLKEGK
jgi:hypothetical protein